MGVFGELFTKAQLFLLIADGVLWTVQGRTAPSQFPSSALPSSPKIQQPHLHTEGSVSGGSQFQPLGPSPGQTQGQCSLRLNNVPFLELGLLCPEVAFLHKEAFLRGVFQASTLEGCVCHPTNKGGP